MGIFKSSYVYSAERMFPKFWLWRVRAHSNWAIQGDGTLYSFVDMDNLTKDAAIGFAKLKNGINNDRDNT